MEQNKSMQTPEKETPELRNPNVSKFLVTDEEPTLPKETEHLKVENENKPS